MAGQWDSAEEEAARRRTATNPGYPLGRGDAGCSARSPALVERDVREGAKLRLPGLPPAGRRGTPRWRPVSVTVVWLTATNQVDQFYVWEVVAHGCKNLPEVQLPHN